jgi:K+/H+ antiporter YhaU regulatory subunit KhtT
MCEVAMSNDTAHDMPRYLRIAVDIAERIATGEIEPGTRLKGRSVLSSEFHVSPETIRRAMAILSDMNVVKVSAGSGIRVLGQDQAIQFVRNYRSSASVKEMRAELYNRFDQAHKLQDEIRQLSDKLLEHYQYRRGDLIVPVEIAVPDDSPLVGLSIGQCQVWLRTGATIIGVVQKNKVIVSPGPYYEFTADDKLLVVGDEDVIDRMRRFLTETPESAHATDAKISEN